MPSALTPATLWFLLRPATRRVLLGAAPVLVLALTPSAFWTRYVLAVPCALLAVTLGAAAQAGPGLRFSGGLVLIHSAAAS